MRCCSGILNHEIGCRGGDRVTPTADCVCHQGSVCTDGCERFHHDGCNAAKNSPGHVHGVAAAPTVELREFEEQVFIALNKFEDAQPLELDYHIDRKRSLARFISEHARATTQPTVELSGWQPIATAPKDNPWILGLTPSRRCVVVRWGGGTWEDDNRFCRDPKFWMPLPLPAIPTTQPSTTDADSIALSGECDNEAHANCPYPRKCTCACHG